jgi:hypothetical protein
MARGTAPLLYGRVDSCRVQLQIFFAVALITELVALLLEQKLAHDSVPKVTLLALLVVDDLVNIAHGEVLFDELLVTIEALFPLESSLLCVGWRREAQEDEAATKEHHSDDRRPAFGVCSQHVVANRRIFEESIIVTVSLTRRQSSSPMTKILVS